MLVTQRMGIQGYPKTAQCAPLLSFDSPASRRVVGIDPSFDRHVSGMTTVKYRSDLLLRFVTLPVKIIGGGMKLSDASNVF